LVEIFIASSFTGAVESSWQCALRKTMMHRLVEKPVRDG